MVGGDVKPNTEMDLKCTYCDEFGNKPYNMTLTETSHLPDSNFNLLSLTIMIQGGWIMVGDRDVITMAKGSQTMQLDIKVLTKQGLLFCICLKRKFRVLGGATEQVKPIPTAKVYALLGHHIEETTRKISKKLGWTISCGSMKPCKACSIATDRQKNVPKTHDENKIIAEEKR